MAKGKESKGFNLPQPQAQPITNEEAQKQQERLQQARIEILQLEQAIKDIKCGESLRDVSKELGTPEWAVTFQHASYTLLAMRIGRLMFRQAQPETQIGTRTEWSETTYTDSQYRAIVNETMARMRCGTQLEDALIQAKVEARAGRI
ncbi:hypothetical protein RBB50_011520 [Rhinocladiella similis]